MAGRLALRLEASAIVAQPQRQPVPLDLEIDFRLAAPRVPDNVLRALFKYQEDLAARFYSEFQILAGVRRVKGGDPGSVALAYGAARGADLYGAEGPNQSHLSGSPACSMLCLSRCVARKSKSNAATLMDVRAIPPSRPRLDHSCATPGSVSSAKIKTSGLRKFEAVLVWKLDRWGRSVAHCVRSIQELVSLGIRFLSPHGINRHRGREPRLTLVKSMPSTGSCAEAYSQTVAALNGFRSHQQETRPPTHLAGCHKTTAKQIFTNSNGHSSKGCSCHGCPCSQAFKARCCNLISALSARTTPGGLESVSWSSRFAIFRLIGQQGSLVTQ